MNKKIIIIILFVITLGLAGASAYIGLQLTKDQSPEDSDAAVECISNPSVTSNITFNNIDGCDLTPINVDIYIEDAGSRTSDGACVGTSTKAGSTTLNPGQTLDPSKLGNSCGQCVQIDFSYGGQQYGSAKYTGSCDEEPGKATCGEACTSDEQCTNATGGPVECRNGTCQLPTSVCPDGKTVPGANCECNAKNACGERCGDEYGSCRDGYRCTYAGGPACDTNGVRYCLPTEDLPGGYQLTSCTSGDEYGLYPKKPNGGTGKISAAVAKELCIPEPGVCNDLCGTSANGKECSNGLTCTTVNSGKQRCRLAANPNSNTCSPKVECNEACTANNQCDTGSGQSCIEGLCRLQSNPTSETCQPKVGEPVFSIVKSASPVCVEAGDDLVITYSVTVTNNGTVSGVIDEIVDTYDSQIDSLSLNITSISPSYGTKTSGTVTWIGTEAERTFTAGESKTYKYILTIPNSKVASITEADIDNSVKVQFDTPTSQDNVSSYDLTVETECGVLPTTGIIDDSNKFLLIALSCILGALVLYKFRAGEKLINNLSPVSLTIKSQDRYENKVLIKLNRKKKKE